MKRIQIPHYKHRPYLTIIICLLPMLIGTIWQAISVSVDKNNTPSVGRFVYTDAYDMHYVSKGSGDVAVVFITGSGTPSAYTDFYLL